jgi:hypothetical protein
MTFAGRVSIMSIKMNNRLLSALILAAVLLSRPVKAQSADNYTLGNAPETKPALYLQFQSDGLRIAATPEGLAAAKPIPPAYIKPGNAGPHPSPGTCYYRQLTLPLPKRYPETKARFTFGLPSGPEKTGLLRADYDLGKKDAAGNTWHYLLHTGLPQPEGIRLPDLETLSLSVKTELIEIEGDRTPGKNLGIGLLLQSGDSKIDEVRKNDLPANCMISVIAADGKILATAQGGLGEKFGFG